MGKADMAAGTGKDDRGRYRVWGIQRVETTLAECQVMREVQEGFSLEGI